MILNVHRLNHVILSLLLTSLAMPSWAAQESATAQQQATDDSDEIEEITVLGAKRYWKNVSESSTKMSQPLAETPQSITIINSDFLDSIDAQDYFDSAKYVANVNYNGHQRNVRTVITSRGFGLDSHRGYKLNGNNLIQRSVPDMVTIDRVEFMKGANAIAFGQNPPGGFMNVVTKSPAAEPQGYVSLLYGDYDRVRAEIDYGGPITSSGNIRLRGVAAYDESEVFAQFQSSHGFAGGLFLEWDVTEHDQFALNTVYHDKSATPHFGLAIFPDQTIPDVPKTFAPMQPWADVDYDFLNTQAIYSHQFQNGLEADLIVSRQSTFVDSRTMGPNATAAFPLAQEDEFDPITGEMIRRRGDVTIVGFAVFEDTRSETAEVRFGGDFTFGGNQEHSFLITAEYMNQLFPREDEETLVRNPDGTPYIWNIFNPNYDIPQLDWVRAIKLGFDQTSYSVSAQVIARPFERVQITMGYRWDRIEEDLLVTGTVVSGWQDEMTTPRIALLYEFSDSLNAYYSYSESFSPNGSLDCNNNLLPPRIGSQNEVGMKAEFFNRALLLTLAAYEIYQENLTTGDTCGGIGLSRSRIAGKAKHVGAEAELIGQITPNWSVIASISSGDANFVESPVPNRVNAGMNGVPDNMFAIYSNYTFMAGILEGFAVGVGVSYEDEKQITVPAIGMIPSYTQWDAQIAYTKLEPVTFVLSGINLTDEVGYDSAFSLVGIGNTRRPPRQLSLRVIYDF